MGRPPKEENLQPEMTPKPKHRVVCISEYYNKVRELGLPGNVRDIALGMLFDDYVDRIVGQVNDIKSGDIKFVVRA